MQASPFEALFARLAQSDFRSRFRLGSEEVACIERRGMAVIRRHAEDFVRRRLAPAFIPNDGRQTPMRGHPVFIAQHATACCCRGCLAKWHAIPAGRELTAREQRYVVEVLMAWIGSRRGERGRPSGSARGPSAAAFFGGSASAVARGRAEPACRRGGCAGVAAKIREK